MVWYDTYFTVWYEMYCYGMMWYDIVHWLVVIVNDKNKIKKRICLYWDGRIYLEVWLLCAQVWIGRRKTCANKMLFL